MSLTDEIGDDERIAELERTVRSLNQRLIRAQQRSDGIVETIRQAFHDAATARGPLPPIERPAADKRGKKAEVALWHLTDWQLGKVTASYSTETAIERVQAFCRKAAELTEIQRAHHPVRHCVIALGGDMLENTNTFPGQVYEIDSPRHAPITHQLATVTDLIEQTIRYALSLYQSVEVVAEPGNHGRVGRPGEHNRFDNWDSLAYIIASQRLAGEKRFTFRSDFHWFQRIEIGDYRAMLIHGDEVKSFGGQTPAYALVRKGNAWASGAVPFEFRDIYVGHFHNSNEYSLAAGGKVYMTGSTESDNEYAREFVAAASQPTQRLHFVDPDKGRVTARYEVYL